MLRKRLVGVITVKDGWAVQSFGYHRYLPLGRPEVLAENLDRWGADEILLQCIDRSRKGLGPDIELLERVGALGLATPLIYAGGIASVEQGVAVIRAGADRLCVDALLHDDLDLAGRLGTPLGAQAVIAALPLSLQEGRIAWYDYRTAAQRDLSPQLVDLLRSGAISEALIIDHQHEGQRGGFDERLLEGLDLGLPLIAFGGLSEPAQLQSVLGKKEVAAVAIGNFLSYGEHAIQAYRSALPDLPLRAPLYEKSLTFA